MWARATIAKTPDAPKRARAAKVALTILGYGLVAALLATAIGAASALWSPPARRAEFTATPEWRQWWNAHVPPGVGRDPGEVCVFEGFGITSALVYERSFGPGRNDGVDALLVQVGWPFRAFEGIVWHDRRAQHMTLEWLARMPSFPGASSTLLPFKPRWEALAADVACIGGALWFCCSGWRLLRSAWASHRGVCARCGYPLGGSPACSECGAAVRGAAAPQRS